MIFSNITRCNYGQDIGSEAGQFLVVCLCMLILLQVVFMNECCCSIGYGDYCEEQ